MDEQKIFSLVPKALPQPKQSPLELLEEFVSRVRSGEFTVDSVMVFFLHALPDGYRQPETWTVNMSPEERIAFCELEKARALEEWRW